MNDLNLTFLEEITKGNRDRLRLLAESFMMEAPAACDRLRSLVDRKSFDEVKAEAHSAKPLYHSIGSSEAVKVIDRIEQYVLVPFFHELLILEVNQLGQLTTQLCDQIRQELLLQ